MEMGNAGYGRKRFGGEVAVAVGYIAKRELRELSSKMSSFFGLFGGCKPIFAYCFSVSEPRMSIRPG